MGLLQKPSEKGYRNITLPLLKMEKLTAKESQWLVQGHRGNKRDDIPLKRQRPLCGLLKADGSCSSEAVPCVCPSLCSRLLAASFNNVHFPKL